MNPALSHVDFDMLVAALKRQVPAEGISDSRFCRMIRDHLEIVQKINQNGIDLLHDPIAVDIDFILNDDHHKNSFVVDLQLALEGSDEPNFIIDVVLILQNVGAIRINKDDWKLTIYML